MRTLVINAMNRFSLRDFLCPRSVWDLNPRNQGLPGPSVFKTDAINRTPPTLR